MTEAAMKLEAKRAKVARLILGLDDMELLNKVEALLKRLDSPKEDPFFTNPANIAHFKKSVAQKERGEVVEMTKEEWHKLLLE